MLYFFFFVCPVKFLRRCYRRLLTRVLALNGRYYQCGAECAEGRDQLCMFDVFIVKSEEYKVSDKELRTWESTQNVEATPTPHSTLPHFNRCESEEHAVFAVLFGPDVRDHLGEEKLFPSTKHATQYRLPSWCTRWFPIQQIPIAFEYGHKLLLPGNIITELQIQQNGDVSSCVVATHSLRCGRPICLGSRNNKSVDSSGLAFSLAVSDSRYANNFHHKLTKKKKIQHRAKQSEISVKPTVQRFLDFFF